MNNIGSKLVKNVTKQNFEGFYVVILWPKICFGTYRVNRYF